MSGIAGIAELHERVAAQMVDLARDLGGVLASFEHLDGGGEIACAIGVASTFEQISVHLELLNLCSVMDDLDVTDLVTSTKAADDV